MSSGPGANNRDRKAPTMGKAARNRRKRAAASGAGAEIDPQLLEFLKPENLHGFLMGFMEEKARLLERGEDLPEQINPFDFIGRQSRE